jgi:hypothetical protein
MRHRPRGTLLIRGLDEPVRSCLEPAPLMRLADPVYEKVEIPREHLAHDALAALPVVHAAAHVGPHASKATVEAGSELLPSHRRRVGKPRGADFGMGPRHETPMLVTPRVRGSPWILGYHAPEGRIRCTDERLDQRAATR